MRKVLARCEVSLWGPMGKPVSSPRGFTERRVTRVQILVVLWLASAFEEYVSKVVDFLEENSLKARFEPAEEIRAS